MIIPNIWRKKTFQTPHQTIIRVFVDSANDQRMTRLLRFELLGFLSGVLHHLVSKKRTRKQLGRNEPMDFEYV